MDIHKIRYCNSSGFIIKNDRVKHDIINSLENQIGYNPLNLFEKSYSDRLKDTLKTKDIVMTYGTTAEGKIPLNKLNEMIAKEKGMTVKDMAKDPEAETSATKSTKKADAKKTTPKK